MSFKLKYSDLEELWNYVEKNARGSDLKVNFSDIGSEMQFRTTDKHQDEVTIHIYSESGMMPKLSKTIRLRNEK